jgi:hypothetical protein
MTKSGPGKATLVGFALLFAALLFCALGCGAPQNDEARENTSGDGWYEGEEHPSGDNEDGESSEEGGSVPAGRTVHMCGRSVLGGWFGYWGWDYDPGNPVSFGSFYLVYHEMNVPPDIVDSAGDAARATVAEGDEVMFFKLCFADFVGGDEYGAHENLEANEKIVRDVVEAAVEEEGLTLILGNALPMVREYTDDWLIWNHREYNHFLDEIAGDYGGKVIILDLYGALTASGGWLRPEYAADPYDSHLNDAAYQALDQRLAEILQ